METKELKRWEREENLSLLPLLAELMVGDVRPFAGQEEKLIYGPHPQQHVWFCAPPGSVMPQPTTIIFAHGGGWRSGSATLFRLIGRGLAQLGYPTFLPGYRLAPRFRHPCQLEDVQAGLRLALQTAQEKGVAGRIVLGGQSAGAHLMALAWLKSLQCKMQPEEPKMSWGSPADLAHIRGLFLVSGPLDFSACQGKTVHRLIADYLGETPEAVADPMQYVVNGAVLAAAIGYLGVSGHSELPSQRVLCLHGERDPLVPLQNSLNFAEGLQALGIEAEVYTVPEGHHSDLTRLFYRDTPAQRKLVAWIKGE